MFSFRKHLAMPTAAEALPGRTATMPTAERHFVNGNPIQPPFPEASKQRFLGLAAFGAPSANSGNWAKAFMQRPVGYAGGLTPTPLMRKSAPA